MRFAVPDAEFRFRTSRASGPGGQHVNKTSTRIEVLWDVAGSPSLTDAQRERLYDKLRNRIDSSGVLAVASGERRSQTQNRDAAVERLQKLVADALRVPKPRKRSKVPRAVKEQRLEAKRQQSEKKKMRKPPKTNDE
jgi:ribosome-associated protein